MRGIYFFVEGETDKLFFNRIIKPLFKEKAPLVFCQDYKCKKKEKIESYLKSLKSMEADFLWVEDLDKNYQCIRDKIAEIEKKIKGPSKGTIVIVKLEIESWYYAGLKDDGKKALGISGKITETDNLSKENFFSLKPGRFTSKIDFYQEVLNYFDIELAKKRNKSFKYFIDKLLHNLLEKYVNTNN